MKTEERVTYIKNWLLEYCKTTPTKIKTFVVGISGGIDSSVTSTLCALTGKKTIVLSMPINQIKEQNAIAILSLCLNFVLDYYIESRYSKKHFY